MKSITTLSLLVLAYMMAINDAFLHTMTKPTRKTTTDCSAIQEGTFGMGCFWKPSEEMLKVDGVMDTKAGYTGSVPKKEGSVPTYDEVCFSRDWVEGVRVVYDDEKVSYKELLNAFFEVQEPKYQSRQYGSIIFPHSAEQEAVAKEWLEESNNKVNRNGVPISWTTIEPFEKFYQAEGYHQNYWEKFRPRVAFVVALLVANMTYHNFTPMEYQAIVDKTIDYSLSAVAAFVLLERVVDTKVVEL